MSERTQGILDTAVFDYEGALDTSFEMSKADRLDYGESQMTHAMVLTGVNVVDGQPTRWKVENSWGKDAGNDGFFVMSDAWFEAFMYQIVIDKKHLPDTLAEALQQPPIQLKPWDPMGSLA
jgi:bleomycin hydrolase